MKRRAAFFCMIIFAALNQTHAWATPIFGITSPVSSADIQRLVSFDSGSPGTLTRDIAITGLDSGYSLAGIDFRSGTDTLYAVAIRGLGESLFYTVDTVTGVATQLRGSSFIRGTDIGFDFDPVGHRIRIDITFTRQNIEYDPATGVVVDHTPLIYAPGDVNAGMGAMLSGSAYTNNFAGATSSTLYGIDAGRDALVIQGGPDGVPSADTGLVFTVGLLGVDVTRAGFDIAPDGTAFLSSTNLVSANSGFYTVNLATGAATFVGAIGSVILDIAVPATPGSSIPEPPVVALFLIGIVGIAASRRRSQRCEPVASRLDNPDKRYPRAEGAAVFHEVAACPYHRRTAGLTRQDHLAHHAVIDSPRISHRRAGHDLPRRADRDSALTPPQTASCTYRVALGPRAGQKVLSLQTLPSPDKPSTPTLCAKAHGFSLHAAVRWGADQRPQLEHLCRYITRPAIANERLIGNHADQVVLH